MTCRKCGYAITDYDTYCPQCGTPRAVYSPPEGFAAVAGETSYYKLERTPGQDGREELRAVAFDPVGGGYTVVPPPQALFQSAPPPAYVLPPPNIGAGNMPPAYAGNGANPSGLQPFVPPPMPNRPIHHAIRGTGYVSVLGFLAWLTAVAGPVIAAVRTVKGLGVLVESLIDGTVSDITEGFLENFNINPGDFSGVSDIWDLAKELPGGITGLLFGFLVFLLMLVPFFFMVAALRTNPRAGRVLVIVNFALCALGSWLCYSVFMRVENLVGVLPKPYAEASQFALFSMIIAAALWVIAAVVYFILAAKSKRQN